MVLKKLSLKSFRNLKDVTLNPCDGINIIYADNAQGKTNLLESIWFFTGLNSFRNAKISECIGFGEDFATSEIIFEDNMRVQKAAIKYSSKKSITLNAVPIKKASDFIGNVLAVVFSPLDLDLIKSSSKARRKFLDIAISQIKPTYSNYISSYENILSQRNALIKNAYKYQNLSENLEIWDLQLAKMGTIISIYRNDYLSKFNKIAAIIYDGIADNKEKMNVSFASNVFLEEEMSNEFVYDDKFVDIYLDKLAQSREKDIKSGFTNIGIHRDDIDILVDGHDAKAFASQGQKRSCVITFKLAQAKILKLVTKENPIILLDDVMSELDKKRQDFILNHVKNRQVFLTCCDYSNIDILKKGRIFKMQNGEILEETEI